MKNAAKVYFWTLQWLVCLAHLRDHVLEGLHNLVRLVLLVVREDARHYHHERQHRAQVDLWYVVDRRYIIYCTYIVMERACGSLGAALRERVGSGFVRCLWAARRRECSGGYTRRSTKSRRPTGGSGSRRTAASGTSPSPTSSAVAWVRSARPPAGASLRRPSWGPLRGSCAAARRAPRLGWGARPSRPRASGSRGPSSVPSGGAPPASLASPPRAPRSWRWAAPARALPNYSSELLPIALVCPLSEEIHFIRCRVFENI